jgi:hypothetical protein
MGKLRNFEKIKWKPFQHREGQISVTNYYTNKEGKKCPMQSHLDIPRFSFFEIIKWEDNPYYGKLQEYLNDGWEISFGGDFLQKNYTSLQLTHFTHNTETCYMLASWSNMDHDEKSPGLEFTGNRPMALTAEEQVIFMKMATEGQAHIEKVLHKFDDNEDSY